MKDVKLLAHIWVVLDQKGLDTSTCIVVEQNYGEIPGTEDEGMLNTSQAARVPLRHAVDMIGNLYLGNMGFEEWADVDAGLQSDGTYILRGHRNCRF